MEELFQQDLDSLLENCYQKSNRLSLFDIVFASIVTLAKSQ